MATPLLVWSKPCEVVVQAPISSSVRQYWCSGKLNIGDCITRKALVASWCTLVCSPRYIIDVAFLRCLPCVGKVIPSVCLSPCKHISQK